LLVPYKTPSNHMQVASQIQSTLSFFRKVVCCIWHTLT
jgi:hypothetical protein